MRISTFTRNAFLFVALASPAFLLAQFQAPSTDELKMTADPKAPGADAVYFERDFDVDDSNGHFMEEKTAAQDQWCQQCPAVGSHEYYERMKVLTEKGKALATLRIPYDNGDLTITEIHGRTIQPDGTVIPLSVTPSDLMEYRKKNPWSGVLVLNMPSVEVGSILEYRLKMLYNNFHSEPKWNVQQPYFVHKAHYSFHPYVAPQLLQYFKNSRGQIRDHLMYTTRIGDGTKVNHITSGKELYTLDLTDIPAVPVEDWMSPLNLTTWNVQFFYTTGLSGDAFWEDAGKQWAREVEEFTNPSGDLKKAASDMVAAGDSDDQKAAKIYTAVMKLDNTDFSRNRSGAARKNANAEDVWKQHGGSANDIARLYVALAGAAGLAVWPMQVVNRDHAFFDASLQDIGQLNDYIAVADIGGKEVYLDPGQKMCPYGQLHWKHNFATGFRLSDKGTVRQKTPGNNYKLAVQRRIADLAVDAQGNVSGTVGFAMIGPDALYWRQLALQNDPDEVKKQFNQSLEQYLPEGLQAEVDQFQALDDYSSNLTAVGKISGKFATATGNQFILPGLFFESRAWHPFVAQDKRTTPIDVHYGGIEQDSVTYHLPSGFAVASAPQAANLSWPGNASLGIGSNTTADSVNVQRSLVSTFTLLDPKDYSDLHDFCQKVAAADQQQLVLTSAPGGKGN